MPRIIRLEGASLDLQKFSKTFEDNCGLEMTTESIAASIKRVAPLFAGDLISLIKESGLYITAKPTP